MAALSTNAHEAFGAREAWELSNLELCAKVLDVWEPVNQCQSKLVQVVVKEWERVVLTDQVPALVTSGSGCMSQAAHRRPALDRIDGFLAGSPGKPTRFIARETI